MVRTISKDDKDLYQCQACGFHYVSEETAKKCEEWCRRTNSCNLEIIKDAIDPPSLEATEGQGNKK